MFGGGTKPMLDANVQKIVDAGFTEEQAENALKITRYNADKALKNLQRGAGENKKERPAKQAGESGKGRKGRNKDANDEDGVSSLKPTGKLSLFDFLEDKLPITPESEKPAKSVENASHKDEHKYDKGNNERKNQNKGGTRGGRTSTNRNPSAQSSNANNKFDNNMQNSSYWQNDNQQRNYNNYSREDRPQYSYNSQQIQNEKPPRFQRKQEGEAKKQQSINMSHEPSYPQNYQQQLQQSNYYSDRRNMTDNRNMRGFYNQQQMDSLANATSAMSLDSQQQNRFNNYRQNTMQNYQNNYSYPTKPNYNNTNFQNDVYKRNNQFQNNKSQMPNISNGQSMNQSFYNQYAENQMKNNQNNASEQPDILDVLQQQNNQSLDQRNNFNYRGNGFYQTSNIVGFQNATINEQARKMLAEGSEVNWSIGDRCLAKYWEDNGVSYLFILVLCH